MEIKIEGKDVYFDSLDEIIIKKDDEKKKESVERKIFSKEKAILIIKIKKFLNPRLGVNMNENSVCFRRCTNIPEIEFLSEEIQDMCKQIALLNITDNIEESEVPFVEKFFIEERIENIKKVTLKEAKRIILKKFFYDPNMHSIFLGRPDMTKRVGISFCKKVKNPHDWFSLLNHDFLKFTVPEMLYWSILADKKYNSYIVIAEASETTPIKFSDLSILSKILEREDVVDFVKKESIVKLLLLKIKLNNKKVDDFISNYRKDVWEDPENIIQIRLFSFLVLVITYLPLSVLLRLHTDVYLQILLNKKKH